MSRAVYGWRHSGRRRIAEIAGQDRARRGIRVRAR